MKQRHVSLPYNLHARIAGRDAPAAHVLEQATQRGLPLEIRSLPSSQDDPALIDLSLAAEGAVRLDAMPQPGLGYAGLSAWQRRYFLDWLRDPTRSAPPAFQQLYVAQLEVRLLEDDDAAHRALDELIRLSLADAWRGSEVLGRATLLGFWLRQDGAALARWLTLTPPPAAIVGTALGCQALLRTPLAAEQLEGILSAWNLPVPGGPVSRGEVLRLRLSSVANALGTEPLAYTLETLPESQRSPRPWRTAHRDLRLALPQPDVRPALEPILRDMLEIADVPDAADATDEKTVAPVAPGEEAASLDDLGWRLILEFGHSRSEFFETVVRHCQRMPGYSQLMDEDRRLVYRVIFKKSEMRRFWQIWDYVQNWSHARVFLNGDELERWKIWPYSQYLR